MGSRLSGLTGMACCTSLQITTPPPRRGRGSCPGRATAASVERPTVPTAASTCSCITLHLPVQDGILEPLPDEAEDIEGGIRPSGSSWFSPLMGAGGL